jgi:ribosomal protein S18 acetylase RimI-like enzyme
MSWFPDAAALRQFAGTTLQWPLTRSQLDAIRADSAARAWTGWTNGVLARRVAHAELVRLEDDRFLLARVAVAPRERGRGLGATLLCQVIENVRALRIRRLELNVFSGNESALRLYRSAGFEAEGTFAGDTDVLRMARSLS